MFNQRDGKFFTFRPLFFTFLKNLKLLFFFLWYNAVSYTHLDVYKRQQYALSDAMGSYWSNFAKHGNPNGPGLPDWEPLSSTAPQYLRLEAEGVQTEATRFPEKLELLKSKL